MSQTTKNFPGSELTVGGKNGLTEDFFPWVLRKARTMYISKSRKKGNSYFVSFFALHFFLCLFFSSHFLLSFTIYGSLTPLSFMHPPYKYWALFYREPPKGRGEKVFNLVIIS